MAHSSPSFTVAHGGLLLSVHERLVGERLLQLGLWRRLLRLQPLLLLLQLRVLVLVVLQVIQRPLQRPVARETSLSLHGKQLSTTLHLFVMYIQVHVHALSSCNDAGVHSMRYACTCTCLYINLLVHV